MPLLPERSIERTYDGPEEDDSPTVPLRTAHSKTEVEVEGQITWDPDTVPIARDLYYPAQPSHTASSLQ